MRISITNSTKKVFNQIQTKPNSPEAVGATNPGGTVVIERDAGTYHVSAVYDDGKHSAPVTVKVADADMACTVE